ncbi:MAG TPA: T9SS type A sorting domain-containing protein [Flavobacterium sp.]
MGRHYLIYLENNEIAKNPFSYSLITNGDEASLVVTNGFGDKAFYGNAQLGTQHRNESRFAVYPNPVKDILNFSNVEQDDVVKFTVINVIGKELLVGNDINWTSKSIYIGELANGIYFVRVNFKNGQVVNKRIIKTEF